MRSIFGGVIMLLSSTAVVHAGEANKQGYAQAFIGHQEPIQVSRDKPTGVDNIHPDLDALTRRIERDNTRLDRLIEICRSC